MENLPWARRPRLTVLGTGYLGMTHAACMASLGFQVLGVDTDADKVARPLSDLRVRQALAQAGQHLGLPLGQRLYLSEATVKGYVSRMLDKLGCANSTQAGLLAHDAGIVKS